MAIKLFVFDLDFTLWDCGGMWIDHSDYPFTKRGDKVYDSMGIEFTLYPDVLEILNRIQSAGIPMALASRTGAPPWARELLELYGLREYFDYEEIYPSSKIHHFKSLKERSNIDYSAMAFFDDEERNIQEVSAMGVNCIHVRKGINMEHITPFL